MNTHKENKSFNLTVPTRQVDKTVRDALACLRRNAKKELFLFVHTFQVPAAYAPPEEHWKLFEPFSRDGGEYSGSLQPLPYLRDQVSYDRETHYTDDQLKQFFRGLFEMGMNEQTIVFVTADHGEEFLAHGYLQHGAHLYEEAIRVPLIFWGPRMIRNGPRRVATLVSILELMPMMLELVGILPRSGLRGVSVPSTLAYDMQALSGRELVIEAWEAGALSENGPARGWNRLAFAVRTDRHKYVMTGLSRSGGPRFEIYDLTEDPLEANDLARAANDPLLEGKRVLASYRAAAAVARRRKLIGATQFGHEAQRIPLGPEREEKLRGLGYIG